MPATEKPRTWFWHSAWVYVPIVATFLVAGSWKWFEGVSQPGVPPLDWEAVLAELPSPAIEGESAEDGLETMVLRARERSERTLFVSSVALGTFCVLCTLLLGALTTVRCLSRSPRAWRLRLAAVCAVPIAAMFLRSGLDAGTIEILGLLEVQWADQLGLYAGWSQAGLVRFWHVGYAIGWLGAFSCVIGLATTLLVLSSGSQLASFGRVAVWQRWLLYGMASVLVLDVITGFAMRSWALSPLQELLVGLGEGEGTSAWVVPARDVLRDVTVYDNFADGVRHTVTLLCAYVPVRLITLARAEALARRELPEPGRKELFERLVKAGVGRPLRSELGQAATLLAPVLTGFVVPLLVRG